MAISDTQALIPSDRCSLVGLLAPYGDEGAARGRLLLDEGWTRRWTSSWLVGEGKVSWPLRDMGSVPMLSSRPFRGFTWRAKQKHRPGLQFMVSTGRHHAFESLEEQRLLLALDFLGVREVLPQPFELGFDHVGGRGRHIPDFLAVMPDGMVLFDVRPAGRIGEDDQLKFDAAALAAQSCGWHYAVVTGWRQHVHVVLDHLSSQRRPLQDQLGLQPQLIEPLRSGPVPFGELVERTSLPAVARAHATHLLWHRGLGVDLGVPLGDRSPVWLAQAQSGRQ